MEQLSMFDMIPSVGKWYEKATTEVPFDDLKVGEIYLLDCSTESHKWYLSVMVVQVSPDREDNHPSGRYAQSHRL